MVSGLAPSVLWYLGEAQVTPRVIESIRENLSPQAFLQLKVEAGVRGAMEQKRPMRAMDVMEGFSSGKRRDKAVNR